MTGNELQFALGAPEMVVMVASLVLCHISFSTGRTNVLNGAAHLALFAAYLMTIFASTVISPPMTEIGGDNINSCLLYFFILPEQVVNQNCEPVPEPARNHCNSC